MQHRRMALGALICAVAGVSAAEAQVTPQTMLGGGHGRKIDLRATADATYDSNIARTTEAQAAMRGLSVSDTIYSPSVSVDAFQPVGRQALFVKGSLSYLWHQNNRQLDGNRVDIAAGLGNKFGPCGSTLIGSYSRGRNELEDITLSTAVENILEVKRIDGAVTCTTPTGLGVLITGGRVVGTTSDTQTANGNYNTSSATAGLIYSRASTGTISVVGTYAKTEYPDRIPIPGGSGGYEMTGGGVNLERRLGGRIEANASINYSVVQLLDPIPAPGAPVLTDFKGLTYAAGLTYRASSRLHAQAQFQRQISPTLIQGQTYEVQTNFNVSADYRIGSRITAIMGVRQQETDARGNVSTIVATTPLFVTHSTTKAAFASLRYVQSRRVSVALNLQRETRDADNPIYNYTSNRIGVALTATY